MVRKIKAKQILELRNQGLSRRAIESAQGMSRHSIRAVLDAAERLGLGWDDVTELSEATVYSTLFPGRGVHESVFAQPDWGRVHTELARVGVTLKLLHQEYVDQAAMAQATMSYDRFCRLYAEHATVSGATSRVGHKAGRSIEVDWSGPTMQLLDPTSGEMSKVYLFVACLPSPRRRRSRRRHHGPHHPQHHLGRHRHLQHEGTNRTRDCVIRDGEHLWC
jgi:transposase